MTRHSWIPIRSFECKIFMLIFYGFILWFKVGTYNHGFINSRY
jgi:hypothetical protein